MSGSWANFATALSVVFCCTVASATTLNYACSTLVSENITSTAVIPQSKMDVPYWRDVYTEQLKSFRKSNAKILFIGDSLTNRWPNNFWKEKFHSFQTLKLGVESDKTQNVSWRIKNGRLLESKPEAVVLLIGTNNKESAQEVAGGIAAILALIQEQSPDTRILLISLLPKTPAEHIAEINQIVSGCSDNKHIKYANYYPLFIENNGEQIAPFFSEDKLHLSTEGYRILSQNVWHDLDLLLRLKP